MVEPVICRLVPSSYIRELENLLSVLFHLTYLPSVRSAAPDTVMVTGWFPLYDEDPCAFNPIPSPKVKA